MSARVVLVTGARKGLGRELCEYYLARGCVVEGCSRQESTLRHANYRHHCVDVTIGLPISAADGVLSTRR